MNNLGGDNNVAMIPLIGRTEQFIDFLFPFDVPGHHNAAPKLYFWSMSFPAPKACSRVLLDVCETLGRPSFSASNTLAEAREMMDPDGNLATNDSSEWQQVLGRVTATPEDNRYLSYCTKSCATKGSTSECPEESVCDTVAGTAVNVTCVKICKTGVG